MSLFSAIKKTVLLSLSDRKKNFDTKRAHQKAFASTGKKIKYANSQHRRIDGKATYRSEYRKEMATVNNRARYREKFIDYL